MGVGTGIGLGLGFRLALALGLGLGLGFGFEWRRDLGECWRTKEREGRAAGTWLGLG